MLKVRPMQVSDLDRVYTIELASHKAPWSRSILQDCILVGYNCRVLESTEKSTGPRIVGYLIARQSNGVCHILNLCIDVSCQGKGYGRFLLKNLLESLDKNLIATLILEVRPTNKAAIALYESLGFQRKGIKTGYYMDEDGKEEDALVLKKWL
ncbi:ribosomal protein S18-alanine N-acetyltransferase [Legionella spiritensis]|uniref:ribosomal protein S18-alanine N-acetyltransferase n=1 Tax=Legionella spiritensis TaxID=452 RepID=UPI000F703E21|nr:ribosomal protein S18-alanine N-acetyltransferase [Legionella spiritensis]VEG90316.1 GCN5-related N-acetyltransferase [Legionella spiritensis]